MEKTQPRMTEYIKKILPKQIKKKEKEKYNLILSSSTTYSVATAEINTMLKILADLKAIISEEDWA